MSREFATRYGAWALVAGASEGLGAEFARQLAARGLNLLLIARRIAALDELAQSLRSQYGITVRTAAVDLAAADLEPQIRALTTDLEIGLLVYNAAYSVVGEFLAHPLEDALKSIAVNCRGPVILSHLLGQKMVERRRGGIVLMASMAAGQGSPLVATYAATKAFDLVLAEGLWEELGHHGVDVVACRAGATRTPGYERTKPQGSESIVGEPGPVVSAALDSLGRSPSVVPGFINGLSTFLLGRLLPRRASVRIMSRAIRSMYPR